MKKQVRILLVFGACAIGFAADEQETIMKAVGQANGSLRKNVNASAMSDAAKDAHTIAELMKKEEAWWEGKGAADATKFSQDAQAAAKSIATAADAGKAEDVAAGQKALGATCQGCHAAHREKTDSGYKTKM